MSLKIETKVGPSTNVDGSESVPRTGKTGEVIIGQAHGKYYEATSRNRVFTVLNTGATTQAGISNTSPIVAVFNPLGSPVNVSILNATIAFASSPALLASTQNKEAATEPKNTKLGVLKVGTSLDTVFLVTNLSPITDALTFPSNASYNNLAANFSCSSVISLTGEDIPASDFYVPVKILGCIHANSQGSTLNYDIDGSIVLTPGSCISIQASQAISLAGSITWEEIPI